MPPENQNTYEHVEARQVGFQPDSAGFALSQRTADLFGRGSLDSLRYSNDTSRSYLPGLHIDGLDGGDQKVGGLTFAGTSSERANGLRNQAGSAGESAKLGLPGIAGAVGERQSAQAQDQGKVSDKVTSSGDKQKPKFNELIEQKGASDEATRRISDQLDRLPPHIQQRLKDFGIKVVVAGQLSDHDPAAAGERPRGWPPGSTFDMAGGYYQAGDSLLSRLGLTNPGGTVVINERVRQADGTFRTRTPQEIENTTGHELGHALDHALGNFSHSKEFADAYERDMKGLSTADRDALKYFLQSGNAGKEELFAEIFSDVSGGAKTSRTDVLQKFPSVRKLVEERLKQLGK